MTRIVEVLLYALKPGSGAAFHRIMIEASIPLHRTAGMDVVSFGPSLHDPDAYCLIRSYDSIEHLRSSQESFYASESWRQGPRDTIISCIVSSLRCVSELSIQAVDGLRRT